MSGNSSPTEGQWQLTMDDRALLLPSSSASPQTLRPSAPSSSAVAVAVAGDGGDDVYGAGASAASAVIASADVVETHFRAKPSSIEVKSGSSIGGGSGDSSLDVYTITADDSLPSHMRSLLPGHDKHVHDLLNLERTRQKLRYVILGLTLMLALTVVVAVALVLSLKVTPPHVTGFMVSNAERGRIRSPSFPAGDIEETVLQTEVKVSLLDDVDSRHHQDDSKNQYRHFGLEERRTPCVTECWSYAAFRFRSVCQKGFCRCHADDYDTDTCLPKYHSCNIEKVFPSQSSARLFSRNQTSYTCNVRQSHVTPGIHGGVHVISIFGNHRAETTRVTVRSQPLPPSSSSPLPSLSATPSPSGNTLVLVNYHFVEWTVHLPEDSGITKVIIVSMKKSNQADRVLFTGPTQDPDVEVTYKLSLTGYGEDKNGGHTPRLLRFVEEQIGPVTSFLGTSHADEIFLDLNFSKSQR